VIRGPKHVFIYKSRWRHTGNICGSILGVPRDVSAGQIMGCIQVLNGMIVVRVVDQASRSHTHLFKDAGHTEKNVAVCTKMTATLSVFEFLELVSQYNRADIFSQVQPVGLCAYYLRFVRVFVCVYEYTWPRNNMP